MPLPIYVLIIQPIQQELSSFFQLFFSPNPFSIRIDMLRGIVEIHIDEGKFLSLKNQLNAISMGKHLMG